MIFPRTALLEDFASALSGAKWTTPAWGDANAFAAIGGQGGESVAGNAALCSTPLYGPDCEVYFQVPVLPVAGNVITLRGRMSSSGGSPNGYGLNVISSTGAWTLRKVTAGSSSQIGSGATQVVAANDWLGWRIIGALSEAWHKPAAGSWTLLSTALDSTYGDPGLLGCEVIDTTVRIDNLGGGLVPGDAAPILIPVLVL